MGLFSLNKYSGTLRWEKLDNIGDGKPQYVSRAKVFGGWLISLTQNASIGSSGVAFIPDEKHEWLSSEKLDSKKSN